MDTNSKLLLAIVSLAVGIIVTATVLIPVLNDAVATSDTMTNKGYYRMSHYDTNDSEEITITWTYEQPKVITVNDVDVPILIDKTLPQRSITVIGDTSWVVRLEFNTSGDITGLAYIQSEGSIPRALVSNSATASLTMSAGTMEGTIGTTSVSNTYTDLYVPSLNGPYIMKEYNTPAYIKNDSLIFAYGMTTIDGSHLGLEMSGNYADGLDTNLWRGSATFTIDTPVIHATTESNHKDLYQIENITLTANKTATGADYDLTYSYFLVPYQVTAERSIHFTSDQIGIFSAIPVLVIIAILIMAASLIIKKRE